MYLRHKRLDKKVFLATLFVAQVFLIGIFLIFGTIYSEQQHVTVDCNSQINEFDVQFVQNGATKISNFQSLTSNNGRHQIKVESTDKPGDAFAREFVHINNSSTSDNDNEICFRDGSLRDSKTSTVINECQCRVEYHGKDCGQPEVIWRAFMTSKVPLKLLNGARKVPHKIFYLINTTDITVETIEMQIIELVHVVDLFIFCRGMSGIANSINSINNNNINNQDSGLVKNHIKTGVFKEYYNKILFVDTQKCTPKIVYKKFRQIIAASSINGTDILLYSNMDEILNWRAVKYLKWYDNWPQPVRFRLRYTVYGYFWQHPQNTAVGSAACQLNVLNELYKNDPEQMINTRQSAGMIVGDLNHVGGWYCQYCYHPMTIVRRLLADGRHDVFLDHKNTIDSIYIESLIANGLYVDGKLGLSRVHRSVDKYFAPNHVTNSSWKYENLLTNIYVNYDDDYAP